MSNSTLQCPVCRIALPIDAMQCPDCGQDLSVLAHLFYRSEILYNQALGQARAGDMKRAIRYLEEALDADETNTRVLVLLGKLYGHLGQHSDARCAFSQALALAPDLTDAVSGMQRIDDLEKATIIRLTSETSSRMAWQKQAANAQRWRNLALLAIGFGLGVIILFSGQKLQQSLRLTTVAPISSNSHPVALTVDGMPIQDVSITDMCTNNGAWCLQSLASRKSPQLAQTELWIVKR